MIKIFAKYNTAEKVAVLVDKNTDVKLILRKVEDTLGGSWTYIDDLKDATEVLNFNDGHIYKGYQPDRKERYCTDIVNLVKTP